MYEIKVVIVINLSKYIKMILYKVSLEHNINLTTIEKYENGEYKRTIILKIDNEKEFFNNQYMLLDFLQGFLGDGNG